MAYKRVGLGAVVSPDGTDITYPWYCDFFGGGFAELAGSECAPATPAQLQAMQTAQLAKIAAVNPAAAAASITAGNAATAALANSDPADAAAYTAAVNNPTLSSIFGTDAVNLASGVNPNTGASLTSIPTWLIVGGVALVGAVIFLGGRR